MADLSWHPVLGLRPLALLALIGLVLAVVAYLRPVRQRPVLATVLLISRLLAIGALLVVLAGPSRPPVRSATSAPPRLYLMVDLSESMQTPDVGGKARIQRVVDAWLDDEQLEALAKQHDVLLVGFDEQLRQLSVTQLRQPFTSLAVGRRSEAMAAMDDLLTQVPQGQVAQIVWFGDGRETTGHRSVIAKAVSKGIRIHTVAAGGEVETPDLAIGAESPGAYLMQNEKAQMLVTVRRTGFRGPQSTTVHMTSDSGVPYRVDVAFKTDEEAVTIAVPLKTDRVGRTHYRLRVDSFEGEAVVGNNHWNMFVRVIDGPLRVLVLEGEPYWDTKFLAQALRRDARLLVHQMTQIAPGRPLQRIASKADEEIQLPKDVEELSVYDVVIVGRGLEQMFLPEFGNVLRQYVERGGGLIFARGRAYDPDTPKGVALSQKIRPLEPVRFGVGLLAGSTIRLTELGRSSRLFEFGSLSVDGAQAVADAPAPDVLHISDALKPAARSLAECDSSPVVVEMGYGRGRVVAILAEGLWRWRLRSPEVKSPHGLYAAFWTNLVRDLAVSGFEAGADLDLRVSSGNIRLGDPLHLEVALRSDPPATFKPSLTLEGPGGVRRTIAATPVDATRRRWVATARLNEPGIWTAALNGGALKPAMQSRPVAVHDLNVERLRAGARPDVMRQLATQTGGQFYRVDAPVELAHELEAQRAALLPQAPWQFAWDQGWVLILIVMWMAMEWIGRRAAGWL
jgi:hypothetical protein